MAEKDIFKSTSYPLSKLIDDIEDGDIALPDLQRPFVWKSTQIRDLFDSLFRGYPAGFILLWEISSGERTRKIGTSEKKREPRFLVIDGQQRLTSLYSIIKNSEIVDEGFKAFKPKIAFNPLKEEFEVYNPAIGKDIFWIDDVSDLFKESGTFSYITNFLKKLKEIKEINNEEAERIARNIERLEKIKSYPFTVIELGMNLDAEMVSDIFIRVNSKGKSLNQSDFVMTVLSVYRPGLREKIERFSLESKTVPESNIPSPYNNILQPNTDHLIRTIVADAFTRGRLRYAHVLLKGRDLKTKKESKESRDKSLKLFKQATERTLSLIYWHDFIKILKNIGIVNKSLISSALTIYFTYAFYLRARELEIDSKELEAFVGSWIYFSILTSRYIGSPETVFEADIILLTKKKDKRYFIETYKNIINSNITEDFWKTTLPNDILVSSSSRNPGYLAYLMVLNAKNVKVLFSETGIRDVLGGEEAYKKNLIDKHHIYPANYLKKKGLKPADINQVANFCYIEYPINIKISDKAPEDYFPKILKQYKDKDLYYHAIPEKFWLMKYPYFLEERRKLISKVIKKGVERFIKN